MTSEDLQDQGAITDGGIPLEEEEALLKVGYAGILHTRYPFQPDDLSSKNDEDAYALAMEKEHFNIPSHLEYPALAKDIPAQHQERIKAIWQSVVKYYVEYHETAEALEHKWSEGAPTEQLDEFSERIINQSNLRINPRFRNGVRAAISKPEEKKDLKRWKREEKPLREALFSGAKKYFVTLRLYYEMLLESNPHKQPPQKTNEDYVLPHDHPSRNEIAQKNRYLRFIDAIHQGIAIGKTAHHGQKQGRIRKTEKIPYIVHSMDVTHATALDVIPFTLDEGMANLAVIIALVGPLHDVIEDADRSIEEICGETGDIRKHADVYDSRIDPLIKSGWAPTQEELAKAISENVPEVKIKNTREYIKRQVLALLKGEVLETVEDVLRLLSNNIKWTDEEKIRAVNQSIADKDTTIEVLGISEAQYKNWKSQKPRLVTKTLSQFPEETDEKEHKSTAFIMRMNVMGKAEARQVALIFKLEDRANNILTLGDMVPEKKRRILRSTTSRIIAYAMLDHNNVKRPLYNALPRCINTAIMGYEKLLAESPDSITNLDHYYIDQLKQWQVETIRLTVPAKVQAVLDQNRELQSKESTVA